MKFGGKKNVVLGKKLKNGMEIGVVLWHEYNLEKWSFFVSDLEWKNVKTGIRSFSNTGIHSGKKLKTTHGQMGP